MNRRASGCRVALALLSLQPSPTQAETLEQALATAYRSSPMLHGQQAAQRAVDETAVQARAGWRPTVTITANAAYQRIPLDSFDYAAGSVETNDAAAALTLNQPLYTGGRVANAVRAADAGVQAGQQGLRATEAQLFQAVILAYMDVLRDQDILAVRQADFSTLERQVRETAARYQLGGPVTRTDVAQAEAQREGASVALADARAQLEASRASYRAAVGAGPGTLVQPAGLPGLPRTLDEALEGAAGANPGLAQAALNAQASGADIATARAAWYPTVGLQGSVSAIGPVSPFRGHAYDREVTGLVTLTQPLLSGGLIASQVRQARDRNEADRQAEALAGRQADQATATAWSQTQSGLAAIAAGQRQVSAAALALKGYQLEYGYGLRTTLDVLIADQDLRAAQVTLAGSRHDTIVAEANLLAATGMLEARRLLPGEPHYDPQTAFRAVRTRGATPWDNAVAAIDRVGGN